METMAGRRAGDGDQALFKRYLVEHGYQIEHEPDLGICTRPDYRVCLGEMAVVCEVKSFSQPTPPQPDQGLTDILLPIRYKIRDAARQLKPLAGQGYPLIVVLAQAENSPVLLNAAMVLSAMYGDLTPVTVPGTTRDTQWRYGRNGKLRHDHQYVSAVAVVQRLTAYDEALVSGYGAGPSTTPAKTHSTGFETAWQAGQPPAEENRELLRLDVYETDNNAPRLPAEFFHGSRDTRWAPDPTRTRVIQTR